jgi:hypothetical protein
LHVRYACSEARIESLPPSGRLTQVGTTPGLSFRVLLYSDGNKEV